MPGSFLFAKFLILPVVFAVILTALLAPLLVTAFRRKVTASMNRASPGTRTARTPNASPPDTGQLPPPIPDYAGSLPWPAATPAPGFRPLPRVPAGAVIPASPRHEALSRHARNTLRRLAVAYGCGGAAQAIVVASVVILGGPHAYLRASVWVPLVIVMSLPVVPTVAHVLAPRPAVPAISAVGGLTAALALGGAARGLLWSAFLLYVLVPAVVFLLFNLRFWRAPAPLVLVLGLGGGLGWLTLVELGRHVVGETSAIWVVRLLGLVTGVLLALPVARGIGRSYRAKRTSEQMLFIDAWWSLLTLIQTIVLVGTRGPVQFVALAGLAAYLLTSRALIRGLRTDRPPAARLLLLRVFGHDRRTERLLDELTLRWRPFGTVDLIAGRDLALRNLDPSEFYDFLTGRLSREFIRDDADLARRLAQRDDRQDPDGRYRVNQFYCHRDTWQPTLDRLVACCDAVLMDLRDFDEERAGCRYEIARLAAHAGTKPIVLLANAGTRLDLAETLFHEAAGQYQPIAMAIDGVFVLPAGRSSRVTVDTATRLLLGCRTS